MFSTNVPQRSLWNVFIRLIPQVNTLTVSYMIRFSFLVWNLFFESKYNTFDILNEGSFKRLCGGSPSPGPCWEPSISHTLFLSEENPHAWEWESPDFRKYLQQEGGLVDVRMAVRFSLQGRRSLVWLWVLNLLKGFLDIIKVWLSWKEVGHFILGSGNAIFVIFLSMIFLPVTVDPPNAHSSLFPELMSNGKKLKGGLDEKVTEEGSS